MQRRDVAADDDDGSNGTDGHRLNRKVDGTGQEVREKEVEEAAVTDGLEDERRAAEVDLVTMAVSRLRGWLGFLRFELA